MGIFLYNYLNCGPLAQLVRVDVRIKQINMYYNYYKWIVKHEFIFRFLGE